MITPEVTSSSSEHWLTIMTCTVCENTPDSATIYKCPMGHVICMNCYIALREQGNLIKCKKCLSSDLKKHQASKDFLNKLKMKPGIGRSRRYNQHQLEMRLSNDFLLPENGKTNITIEKLFHMNTDQVKNLFRMTAKEKRKKRCIKTLSITEDAFLFKNFERGDMGGTFDRDKFKCVERFCPITLADNEHDSITGLSKKPILCPHNPCKKIVTISSFAQHFQYDHRDIPVYKMGRGKALHLQHNAVSLEYGITYCIAILQMHDEDFPMIRNVPRETFWVMVTGSITEDRLKACVVYWILTDSDKHFQCTIDISSRFENVCCSTFCGVARVYDCCNPLNITNDLNCLFLTYASMSNLLSEGSNLNLRVIIY